MILWMEDTYFAEPAQGGYFGDLRPYYEASEETSYDLYYDKFKEELIRVVGTTNKKNEYFLNLDLDFISAINLLRKNGINPVIDSFSSLNKGKPIAFFSVLC